MAICGKKKNKGWLETKDEKIVATNLGLKSLAVWLVTGSSTIPTCVPVWLSTPEAGQKLPLEHHPFWRSPFCELNKKMAWFVWRFLIWRMIYQKNWKVNMVEKLIPSIQKFDPSWCLSPSSFTKSRKKRWVHIVLLSHSPEYSTASSWYYPMDSNAIISKKHYDYFTVLS